MASTQVKAAIAAVGIIAVGVGVYALTRTSEPESPSLDPASVRQASGASQPGSPSRRAGSASEANAPSAAAPRELTPEQIQARREREEREAALRELRELVGPLPSRIGENRAELIEKARKWLRENSDLSPREIELHAQILALYERMFSDDPLSLSEVFQTSEIELLSLWAADADGDGRLSAEEAANFFDSMATLQMQILESGYFNDLFDTDGDGVLSPEETQAAFNTMMERMAPTFDAMTEFAMLRAWDTDNDGFLSESEREAGMASIEGAFTPTVNYEDMGLDAETARRFQIMEAMGPHIQEIMEQATLVGLWQTDSEIDWQSEDMPQMPSYASFDIDGDGVHSSEELAAWHAAVQEFTEQNMARFRDSQVAQYQRIYEQLINDFDTNGDGALSDLEWEVGYEQAVAARDMRIFMMFHDVNQSGRIDASDIATFTLRYQQGSPYADVNFDGVVDQTDAALFLEMANQAIGNPTGSQ